MQQLIYKDYRPGTATLKNRSYRQELFNNIKCTNDSGDNFKTLGYTKSSLLNVFEKYNVCTGSDYTVYANNGGATSVFKITALAGITYSTLKLDNETSSDKDSGAGFTLGAEAAYLIPNSKLAGFLRLTYERIDKEVKGGSELSETISSVYTANINSFIIVIGPRYLLTKNLFLDAGLGLNFAFGDLSQESFRRVAGQDISIGIRNYDISSPIFFSLGVGYNISNSFGVDFRYNTVSNLLPSGSDLKLSNTSLNLRYTFN